MKTFIFAFSLALGLYAHAKSPAKDEFIPSNATEKIFEMLVKTDNSEAKLKAPMSVEVENIVCNVGSGSPRKFKCSAKFSGGVQKDIVGDNDLFFKYLNGKNAIALDEMMLGGTVYKAKSLSCRYALDASAYYRCTSEVSIKF